jgi:hypothetical protein
MLFPAATNYHALYQYDGHAVTNLGMAALGPGFRPTMLVDVITRDGGAPPFSNGRTTPSCWIAAETMC